MTEAILTDRLNALRLDRLVEPPRKTTTLRPAGKSALRTLGLLSCGCVVGAMVAGFLISEFDQTSTERAAQQDVVAQAEGIGTAQSNNVPSQGVLVASGFVVPGRAATVGAPITGTIRSILVKEGSFVRAGQVVAYLDDASAAAVFDRARAQVLMASAEIGGLDAQRDEATATLWRKSELSERGFVTKASLDSSRTTYRTVNAQIAQARANISAMDAVARDARIDVLRHVIRAPFSGVVVTKNAEVGEIVSPVSAGGGFTRTGILTLVDMESLGIDVDISEAHIASLRL